MNKTREGILVSFVILASVAGILAGADAGASSHCPAQFPKWLGCVLDVHEGLAAGSIGAGGALFAGWLAWAAVRKQIRSDIELAIRREQEVFLAVRAECAELFATLNIIWRAVDVALARKSRELIDVNYALVEGIARTLPPAANLETLNEIANQLAPVQRRNFLLVLNGIRWIYQQVERCDREKHESNGDEDNLWRLRSLRTMLSHFLKYLEAFDPETAALFVQRKRSSVDHRALADHLAPSVERAERGENWLT
jgi:hypothetical protein